LKQPAKKGVKKEPKVVRVVRFVCTIGALYIFVSAPLVHR
jgi:hypothetical protein